MALVVVSSDGWVVALFKFNAVSSSVKYGSSRDGLKDRRREVKSGANVKFFDVVMGFGTGNVACPGIRL